MEFEELKEKRLSNMVADCVFVVYRLSKCGFFDTHFKDSDLEKVFYYLTRSDLKKVYDIYLDTLKDGNQNL